MFSLLLALTALCGLVASATYKNPVLNAVGADP
jgi:hypothetical protein